MKVYNLIKFFTFLSGICIAALGTFWVFLAASGAITTGASAGFVAGSGFLLVSAPLLAFPFSVRIATYLFVLALCVLAFGLLWSAFQPGQPPNHPASLQLAAIAFAVLLVALLGWRFAASVRRRAASSFKAGDSAASLRPPDNSFKRRDIHPGQLFAAWLNQDVWATGEGR